MLVDDSSRLPARVLIVGGGFAAVEAALALRALAAERVQLTLISPEPVFHYGPAATLEAFQDETRLRYDLREIAEAVSADHHVGMVESVASQARSVRTESGAHLRYDALILATGARASGSITGAQTFRDQRDVHVIRRLLSDVEAAAVQRVVFAVPSGCTWPLPIYELALLCATRARELELELALSLVTPERAPLAVFGSAASRLVGGLLEERGVRFIGGTAPTGVRRDGAVMLQFDGTVSADRVVAAPELRGRRINGVPASWWGFVPTDMHGRVEGIEDVYAAGDMTTYPVKQGGLATQQADRIAHTIATGLGAAVKEFRGGHVLHARLLGGPSPIVLRAELDVWGQPTSATLEHVDKAGAASAAKVVARYLTPLLETLQPLVDSEAA